MGYRITYENGVARKQIIHTRNGKWKRWMAGGIAGALTVMLLLPRGRLWIRDLLLPGDEEITATALENMVSDLRSGVTIGEAVEAFCEEIIAGGG